MIDTGGTDQPDPTRAEVNELMSDLGLYWITADRHLVATSDAELQRLAGTVGPDGQATPQTLQEHLRAAESAIRRLATVATVARLRMRTAEARRDNAQKRARDMANCIRTQDATIMRVRALLTLRPDGRPTEWDPAQSAHAPFIWRSELSEALDSATVIAAADEDGERALYRAVADSAQSEPPRLRAIWIGFFGSALMMSFNLGMAVRPFIWTEYAFEWNLLVEVVAWAAAVAAFDRADRVYTRRWQTRPAPSRDAEADTDASWGI